MARNGALVYCQHRDWGSLVVPFSRVIIDRIYTRGMSDS